LNNALVAQVTALDISVHMSTAVDLTPELQQICMVAIGATLRGSKKQPKPDQPEPTEQEAA